MTAAAQRGARRRRAGFTLLEILIAMAIFTVLGTMVVYFMRQSLDIFYRGTKESGLLDRMDTILPQVRVDLDAMSVPDEVDAPALPPSRDVLDRMGRKPPPPPPAVAVRLRSGYIRLRDVADPSLKTYPCPYFAFVVADAGEWANKLKRRAGEAPTSIAGQQPLTPASVTAGDAKSVYLPTGGLMEVCWIAVPQVAVEPPKEGEPSYPAILTLYRGYRSPIGNAEQTLLDPANLDTPAKIKAACRPVAEGLLHFGATWRRSFATSWDEGAAIGLGETLPYVGPIWDSTRALDKEWKLFRAKESLPDPSDDIFPAFVSLEATLANPTQFGMGRGDLTLTEAVAPDATRIRVSETDSLMGPNLGRDRYLKVGTEWLLYQLTDVDYTTNEVRVRRAQRGTKATAHDAGAWCYVGLPTQLEMRLPVFRDRYTLKREGK